MLQLLGMDVYFTQGPFKYYVIKKVGGWVRPKTYVCLHSGWVGVASCLRNQKIAKKNSSKKSLENDNFKSQKFVEKLHDIKIKNIFLYYILHLEVALTSEVNMASKVNVILKGQELRVETCGGWVFEKLT